MIGKKGDPWVAFFYAGNGPYRGRGMMLVFGDVMTGRGRDNNFLIIRLLAATAVVVGHSFALSYLECLGCTDPALLLGMPVPVHSLGVEVFFMVSGFLIAASGERNSARDFYLARALRILPGLLVCLLLMAFVLGPVVTSLPLAEYFAKGQVYKYVYSPLLIFKDAQFVLPGVNFTPRFHGVSVNGSLWTIPLEMRMYLVLGVLVLGGQGLSQANGRADTGGAGDCAGAAYPASGLWGVPVQVGGMFPGGFGVLFVSGGYSAWVVAAACLCRAVLAEQGGAL
ncbi:acyltransferase family protein [Pseudomonas putida]|nr:acyltransferase family protein [Pseudomonas putida]